MKLLLVEDDPVIVENLTALLKEEGFQIVQASGQKLALELLEKEKIELALLDISLKDGNGYSLCTAIKAFGDIPVIFLTASDDEYSVVAGLDIGADDYIAKPFRPKELLSRIRSVLRRCGKKEKILSLGLVRLDTIRGTVEKNGSELTLSALEYRLLLIFLNHKGIVLTRNKLLEELWDIAGDFVNDNTLTVYIKRLREKIEDDPQNPVLIKTVRGIGYKAEEE